MNEESYEFRIVRLCDDIDESWLSAVDTKGQYVWSSSYHAAWFTKSQAIQFHAMYDRETHLRLSDVEQYAGEFDDDCLGHSVIALNVPQVCAPMQQLYVERL